MVTCVHDTLVQSWYRSCGSIQPLSEWILGLFYEMKPILDANTSVAMNFRLDRPGTNGKAKYNCSGKRM